MNTWATGLSANDSRLIQFVPGEVTLLFRRPMGTPADAMPRVATYAATNLQSLLGASVRLSAATPFRSESPVLLNRGDFGQYALLTVNLSSWTERPVGTMTDPQMHDSIIEVGDVVPAINHNLLGHPVGGYPGAGTSNRDFVQAAVQAGNVRPVNLGAGMERYELLAATPNWLASSVCTWGGPAGGPVLPQSGVELLRFADGDVQAAVQEGLDVINRLSNQPPVRWQGTRGSLSGAVPRVKIAIFDTWPWTPVADPASNDNWLGALKACRTRVARLGGDTKRLDDFLSGRIRLTVEDRVYGRIAAVHTHPNRRGYLEGSYVQRDHGLFVADIISDIVPNADIVVYRVLNDYGIGDLHTIAQAAADAVHAESPERPIVMNFSLTIGPRLPILEQFLESPLDAYLDGPGFAQDAYNLIGAEPDEDRCVATLRNPASWPVQILHSMPTLPNIFAAAAAGNDSDRDRGRIAPARMPAAIEGVLAVTAGTRDGKEADYSNQPDIEKIVGDDAMMAFGGTTNDETGFTDDGRGVAPVRLYVTDNLGRDGNARGIAQWAGTSFAAPVASGIAACIWSEVLSALGGPIKGFPSIANPTAAKFPPAYDLLTAVVKPGTRSEGRIDLHQPLPQRRGGAAARTPESRSRRGWHWPWSRPAH